MRNLKKVIALVAVFAMLVSTVAFAQTYSDVAATDMYAEAIETLSTLGILTGDDADGDGQMDFRPGDTITRAEVAAIICRIQNINAAAQVDTQFDDVTASHWASGYIAQAAGQNIINGYGDGNFGPDDNVLYEQALKMLMETLGYKPFADDNGGYPTGYITAAQRFGVLDGVVGGATGVEANRGMIAQMVYNAIDTPLMDKYTYGKDAQYVIYNGENDLSYITLLTRDLKMIKVTGTVVANSYTNLRNNSTEVATDEAKTIEIKVDQTTTNDKYGLSKYTKRTDAGEYTSFKLYQGDVDADALLGYSVALYAKAQNSNSSYVLVSIAPNSEKNETLSFNLDQYDGIELVNGKYVIDYLGEVTDKNARSVNLASNVEIIYNGVAGVANVTNYFGNAGDSALIVPNGVYGGAVTLIDADDTTAGYDVIDIEVGVSAVVKEYTNSDQVRFQKSVAIPNVTTSGVESKRLNALDFDGEDSSYMINLTKDGEAFDAAELKKWDVLTIVKGDVYDVYNVVVLGEGNYIDSQITASRTVNGKEEYKLADGNWYSKANDAYVTVTLKAGVTGRFYIDAYGAIVAHDKDVAIEGAEPMSTGNYAYVLNAKTFDSGWGGEPVIKIQILAKDGKVYEAQTAEKVRFTNMDNQNAALISAIESDTSTTVDKAEFTVDMTKLSAATMNNLAAALKNTLITYNGDSAGQFKAIAFAGKADADASGLAYANKNQTTVSGEFNRDNMTLGKVEVTDETIVFYIVGASTVNYSDENTNASATRSVISTGASLVDGENYANYIAFDVDDVSGTAAAVVIMNTTGAIAESNNIAVIDTVGVSVSGTDTVYVVDFYMGGEKLSGVTVADMNGADDIAAAKCGDIFMVNYADGVISEAEKLLVFNRGTAEKAYAASKTAMPVLSFFEDYIDDITGLATSEDAEAYFGAAINVANSGSVALYNYDGTGAFVEVTTVKEVEGTNAYLYDPNMRAGLELSLGSLGDVYADDELKKIGTVVDFDKTITTDDITLTKEDGSEVLGLFDYVYVRKYNNRAADIVVYKAYEFDYDIK